jgi:hypothetical protein
MPVTTWSPHWEMDLQTFMDEVKRVTGE